MIVLIVVANKTLRTQLVDLFLARGDNPVLPTGFEDAITKLPKCSFLIIDPSQLGLGAVHLISTALGLNIPIAQAIADGDPETEKVINASQLPINVIKLKAQQHLKH